MVPIPKKMRAETDCLQLSSLFSARATYISKATTSPSIMSSTQLSDTDTKAEPAPYQSKEISVDQDEEQGM